MKSKPNPAKRGRKRGRKAAVFDLEKIKSYAAMGLTKDDIGRALGYAHACFYKAKAENSEIEEAIVAGRAQFKVLVSKTLVDQMQSGNVTAAIWLDKTRCGTREIQTDDTKKPLPLVKYRAQPE
jgi:hypothetical protein